MATESIRGLMEVNSEALGRTTRSQVMAFITGKMEESMKASGKKTICMATDTTNGQMVVNIRASI